MPKTKNRESTTDSDSGPDEKNKPPVKKSRDGGSSRADGPNQWTLEKLRQVRINEFRGTKMVDIREYYEKDGEYLPGKKGISLTITQWKRLLDICQEVDKALGE